MVTRGPHDGCMGVQLLLTALLGQIYALLSRNDTSEYFWLGLETGFPEIWLLNGCLWESWKLE